MVMVPAVPAASVVSIAWRRLDTPGHDAAALSPSGKGWRLEGAAAFVEGGLRCHLCYRVDLSARWRTRSARVFGWAGGTKVDLRLRARRGGRWTVNGDPVGSVSGCVDVDLAFTPATNLLPIRRLALPVGASAAVDAAWLRFPELTLQPLDQVYSRLAEGRYGYSSSGGTFRTVLSVSPDGFVVDYPGLWGEERG